MRRSIGKGRSMGEKHFMTKVTDDELAALLTQHEPMANGEPLAVERNGHLTADQAQDMRTAALAVVARCVTLIPQADYDHWESIARRQIPRDPSDWPTVALALALTASIWTQDADFLGCGIATWTTET